MIVGLVGVVLGQYREQFALSVFSAAILLWVSIEWLQFTWLTWFDLPKLDITRSVNGWTKPTGILWAGRTVTVELTIAKRQGTTGPAMSVRDVVPENFQLATAIPPSNFSRREPIEPLNGCRTFVRFQSLRLSYTATPRAAGVVNLPGLHVELESPHGFFRQRRFLACEQRFRVLPALPVSGDTIPRIKRANSLRQHGIHRLQRSGMGSELLELREYVSGDPPKSIAWKVSARRGKLMTRQYDSEVPIRVQLLIDGSPATRTGAYGLRLLDQSISVAASVARTAISSGDPVAAILIDEHLSKRVPFSSGERGFHRLMEAFADFASSAAQITPQWTLGLQDLALQHWHERFPELLDSRYLEIPFTIFPIWPSRRRRVRDRYRLAALLAAHFDLSLPSQVRLTVDDTLLAELATRFLDECGVARYPTQIEDRTSRNGHADFRSLQTVISHCVQHARDNEVIVVITNLFHRTESWEPLLSAIKTATSRHHRVVVVSPSPTFSRPTSANCLPKTSQIEELLMVGEQVRLKEMAVDFMRQLRRVGAVAAVSGEHSAIRMVLSEMEFARTGRTFSRGSGR